jgi:predicted nucleic acid-binding protein
VTLYLDSSAFLKIYLEEPDREFCLEILGSDPRWVSARHTAVEVRRVMARYLRGRMLSVATQRFGADWLRMRVLELDEATCDTAAMIGERTGIRALDALHLGAAQRAGIDDLRFLTYDRKQAETARALGFDVVGV